MPAYVVVSGVYGRRRDKKGPTEKFFPGDAVELTADEAARLGASVRLASDPAPAVQPEQHGPLPATPGGDRTKKKGKG